MANRRIGIPNEVWEETLNAFRGFYESANATYELESVPLIAHHDDTLRFTNSTTSVMKGLLLDGNFPADRTYLVQPAMGTQGILAWERDGILSPYPSYFHSMGGLYPFEMGTDAAQEMIALAEQIGFNHESLYYEVSAADQDVIDVLARSEIHYQIDNLNDLGSYRHSYGEERLSGRNANVYVQMPDANVHILGNLTCIERDDVGVAWEISYDSTQVIAHVNQLLHSIDAFSHQIQLQDDTERRVASDAAIISAVLFHEGMHPSSRGKNGIMRKFMRTYVELGSRLYSPEELASKLGSVAMAEVNLRETAASPLTDRYERANPLSNEEVLHWIKKLLQILNI